MPEDVALRLAIKWLLEAHLRTLGAKKVLAFQRNLAEVIDLDEHVPVLHAAPAKDIREEAESVIRGLSKAMSRSA